MLSDDGNLNHSQESDFGIRTTQDYFPIELLSFGNLLSDVAKSAKSGGIFSSGFKVAC